MTELHELFELAMWDEHISHALYMVTAAKTDDQAVKSKLLYLAGDEKFHLEELRDMHEVLCCKKEIHIAELNRPNRSESGFLEPKRDVDMASFLTYAMEKEKSAQFFYLDMSDKLTPDPKASATMFHFSAMEADHLGLLKTELDRLNRAKKH